MDDLIAFMQARLAEDAKRWQKIWRFKMGDKRIGGWWDLGGTFGHAVHHVADPTRGGRETAAKRKRLELYIQAHTELRELVERERLHTELMGSPFSGAIREATSRFMALETAVRLDAYVYAGHKDYDERWKLDA